MTTKYVYHPERLRDMRLTEVMLERIKEHSQLQIDADFKDFDLRAPKITYGMVRIIIEAAMKEYPDLFTGETGRVKVKHELYQNERRAKIHYWIEAASAPSPPPNPTRKHHKRMSDV